MTETTSYTVMELAARVGVPRTTINDWLGKYAPYIDFSMQGKRRVYSDGTLSVLLKVSELRNSGASSFEIERELAKTCAVHPEPAAPEAESPAAGNISGTPSDASPIESGADAKTAAPGPNAGNATPEDSMAASPIESGADPDKPTLPAVSAYSLIAKQQSDEITRILGNRFQDILSKMDNLQAESQKNALRAWIFCALAGILLAVLACGGFLAWRHALQMKHASDEKDRALHALSERTEALNSGNTALQSRMEELAKALTAQQLEFKSELERTRADADKRREAELALERTKSEEEKRAREKEISVLKESIQAREQAMTARENSMKQIQIEMKQLRSELFRTLGAGGTVFPMTYPPAAGTPTPK